MKDFSLLSSGPPPKVMRQMPSQAALLARCNVWEGSTGYSARFVAELFGKVAVTETVATLDA